MEQLRPSPSHVVKPSHQRLPPSLTPLPIRPPAQRPRRADRGRSLPLRGRRVSAPEAREGAPCASGHHRRHACSYLLPPPPVRPSDPPSLCDTENPTLQPRPRTHAASDYSGPPAAACPQRRAATAGGVAAECALVARQ
eukprot:364263-Chlamydomonas_euryale.AAC.13